MGIAESLFFDSDYLFDLGGGIFYERENLPHDGRGENEAASAGHVAIEQALRSLAHHLVHEAAVVLLGRAQHLERVAEEGPADAANGARGKMPPGLKVVGQARLDLLIAVHHPKHADRVAHEHGLDSLPEREEPFVAVDSDHSVDHACVAPLGPLHAELHKVYWACDETLRGARGKTDEGTIFFCCAADVSICGVEIHPVVQETVVYYSLGRSTGHRSWKCTVETIPNAHAIQFLKVMEKSLSIDLHLGNGGFNRRGQWLLNASMHHATDRTRQRIGEQGVLLALFLLWGSH
mmetsp:Transcript_35646/g.72652  ORF Transcript_35646/g.72652 Transcript_35646/m.72652 type:complete len:292 (-) Transcript_35646:86-961(-)|eukprot:CAMPEP_0171739042 /NCGR_PEP_ID=MMETSP0991-20121206/33987_1 /TAXON_ID=483369 /ORGANISM="non described non described, Strain CCMP2098" /LENGTH=291 /DNA_ID=CAMNT_0012336563 /DNA_START=283 /DNA_END=1158 /DNA_ORIENTATION=-